MNSVYFNIIYMLSFAFIGWALAKLKVFSSQNSRLLAALLMWVFLPSYTFKLFSETFTSSYILNNYRTVLISAVIVLALAILNAAIIPKFIKHINERSVCKYSLTAGNFSYIGLALAGSVMSSAGYNDAVMFALPLFIYSYTEGYRMLSSKAKFSLNGYLNPVIFIIILSLFFGYRSYTLPSVASKILNNASECVSPISMLLLGIAASDCKITNMFCDIRNYIITAFRLIVIPIVVCFILSLFCSDTVVMCAGIMYCVPCGINAVIYQKMGNNDCSMSCGLAVISSLFSLLTIPVCIEVCKLLCRM